MQETNHAYIPAVAQAYDVRHLYANCQTLKQHTWVDVIDFGDHFIHLQCQMLRAHAHQAAWERNKQPLNRVELIQILFFYFKTDPELFFKPVAME